MDIISAWKKAKIGDIIKLKHHVQMEKIAEYTKLKNMIHLGFNEEFLLSDDWEIKSKPLVWEGEVTWIMVRGYICPHPDDMPSDFLGKRTKIRIEEIL